MANTWLMGIVAVIGMLAAAPARADGIADFAFVQGVWTSQVEFLTDAGEWGPPARAEATGQPILGGAMVELDAAVPFPGATFMMRMTFAYDRFNEVHRVVVFDDINGYMDVYVGGKDQDGSILVDNAATGTAFPDGEGGMVFGRLRISPEGEGMRISADISSHTDGDWAPYMRMTFSPRK